MTVGAFVDPLVRASDGLFRGAAKTLRFTIYDHDATTLTEPPAVKNLTGFTIEFRMAATEEGAAVVTKAATLDDAAGGICSMALTDADTTGLDAGTYWGILERTDAGPSVLRSGSIVLRARVA